jgi:hypothetical protein
VDHERTWPACSSCKLPAGRNGDGAPIFQRGKPCPNPACSSHDSPTGMTTVAHVAVSAIRAAGHSLPPTAGRYTFQKRGASSRRGGRSSRGSRADRQAPGGSTQVASAGRRDDNADGRDPRIPYHDQPDLR